MPNSITTTSMTQFMHIADIHLGYQQYNSKARFSDFSRVFICLINQAIMQQVDFVILAGDLFEKRVVDPLAMRVAIEGLRMLQDAGIPVVAVEGNHEMAHHGKHSWMDFLDGLGYLYLLNPRFEDGHAILEPYGDGSGAYVDLPGGVRVYGIKYHGASTSKVFGLLADALGKMDHTDVGFTIVIAHAGLEGQLSSHSGMLTHNDLAPLQQRVDYLALGHIHKPYEVDGWIYNPGSPETCNIEESAWPERGYYLVDIGIGGHKAELIAPPRRPFHRLRLIVDGLDEPSAVYDAVCVLMRRAAKEMTQDPTSPVIELTLSGVLPFDHFDLSLDRIEDIIKDALSPLLVRVHNMTTPVELKLSLGVETSRSEMERNVIRGLLERDARYRPAAKEWTRVALDVKQMVVEKSDPDAMIDYLRGARTELS